MRSSDIIKGVKSLFVDAYNEYLYDEIVYTDLMAKDSPSDVLAYQDKKISFQKGLFSAYENILAITVPSYDIFKERNKQKAVFMKMYKSGKYGTISSAVKTKKVPKDF